MTVYELTDGNLVLDRFGNADTLEDVEAEKQMIRNALLIFKGSWFDDITRGPDWLTILEKNYNINQIKSEIKRVLLALDFIVQVLNISLGSLKSDRTTTLTFVVSTENGIITFSEEL